MMRHLSFLRAVRYDFLPLTAKFFAAYRQNPLDFLGEIRYHK